MHSGKQALQSTGEAFDGQGLPKAAWDLDHYLFECGLFIVYNQSRVINSQRNIT